MRKVQNARPKDDQPLAEKYVPSEIEAKWQKIWDEQGVYKPDIERAKKPFYNLMMFPYPSAEGMHVGNMYAFTGADVYGRFKRMLGNDVFEPIGLDGFGIHSENYALKIGKHPMDQAKTSEANFYRQMHAIGNSYDWSRTLETYDPLYYRWTQWLFVQLFKAGLAYRKKANVNFCPSCKTVLADEQVIDGKCERCSSIVEKKALEQWFFAITKYADRLLDNIAKLDWTEKVKIAQREWIGRSEGALIEFKIQNSKFKIEVFTTRPDTLFGATFLVISPEHPFVEKIQDKAVQDYIKQAKKKSEQDRLAADKEKTGVFSGLYVINPVTDKEIPVWIADYVLMGYGTGAVMGVPAHDMRDYAFAQKYDLNIRKVVEPIVIASRVKQSQKEKIATDSTSPRNDVFVESVYGGSGRLINSGDWNDYFVPDAMPKIIDWLEKKGIGKKQAQYHLRDWLISRQRYWGAPIPMIYCEKCAKEGKSWFTSKEAKNVRMKNNELRIMEKAHHSSFTIHDSMVGWYPVPEENLPVELPHVENYKPLGTGKAPLANYPKFYEIACPGCGATARRETDVADTFLDSSWYFLRYPSNDGENALFDAERTRKWLPVDMYIGGAEHSVLHLLYSRFMTMFLFDLGLLDFEEPYKRFFAHGLLIKEGAKMSKSKGNVVIPDAYIKKLGADTLRVYLMFLGQFSQGGDFYDTGIEGMHRFLKRVWHLLNGKVIIVTDAESAAVTKLLHKTIKGVTEDLQRLSYNTAIAKMMEFYNFVSQEEQLSQDTLVTFLKLLAPFAPHMTEELFQRMKNNELRIMEKAHHSSFTIHDSIHTQSWPAFDQALLIEDEVTVVVQVDGKVRDTLQVQSAKCNVQSYVEEQARSSTKLKPHLVGKQVKKVIYVPGKVLNFVVS